MRDQDDEPMSNELADAVALLREKPVVRAEWRDEVLRRAGASALPRIPLALRTHRVSLSMPWALAAGIACALIGASAALLVGRARPTMFAEQQVAASASVMLPVRFSLTAPAVARVSSVG